MSKSVYQLQINCEPEVYPYITKILGVEPDESEPSSIWIWEVVPESNGIYVDFINNFLDVLDGNYERLEELRVSRSSITIWLIHEYEEQCNLEFEPKNLERMGLEGIGLCISCY